MRDGAREEHDARQPAHEDVVEDDGCEEVVALGVERRVGVEPVQVDFGGRFARADVREEPRLRAPRVAVDLQHAQRAALLRDVQEALERKHRRPEEVVDDVLEAVAPVRRAAADDVARLEQRHDAAARL